MFCSTTHAQQSRHKLLLMQVLLLLQVLLMLQVLLVRRDAHVIGRR